MSLFGTSGIRRLVGQLTPEFISDISIAFARYCNGDIVIGTDSRTSSQYIRHAAIAGITSAGFNIYDSKVLTTPALHFAVAYLETRGGLMITASHNPPQYNGIKFIGEDEIELGESGIEKLEKIYRDEKRDIGIDADINWNSIGKIIDVYNIPDAYINFIMKRTREIKRKKGIRVILDCSNGSGSTIIPYLLDKLNCEVISINSHPDGLFPGHLSEPIKENLQDTAKIVRAVDADLGIVLDGDADRVVFIDSEGKYIYGDQSGALFCKQALEDEQRSSNLVITAINSSTCIEKVVLSCGGKVFYTKVSPQTMARELISRKGLIAVEETGGVIFRDGLHCRDAGMAVARMLELLDSKEESLHELIQALPHPSLTKIKVKCLKELKYKVVEEYSKIAREERDYEKILTADGVRIIFKNSWILVRASGTEDIIRIFGEAETDEEVGRLVEKHRRIVEEIIEGLEKKKREKRDVGI